QRVSFDDLERLLERLVAVREERRVAGVVIDGVEALEHLPGQVRDVTRVATGNMLVRQALEQGPSDRLADRGLRSGQLAVHHVEDDALVSKAALAVRRILALDADALLLERVLGQ